MENVLLVDTSNLYPVAPFTLPQWAVKLLVVGLVAGCAFGAAGVQTVSVVEPTTPFSCARIWVVPYARPVAIPCEPLAFEMVATPWFADDHVTEVVRSKCDASEKVPVAINAMV